MELFQCPGCELRFSFANELLDHMSLDHPEFKVESRSQEAELLSAAHRHRHAAKYHASADRNAT
jgi:hypothetical protein